MPQSQGNAVLQSAQRVAADHGHTAAQTDTPRAGGDSNRSVVRVSNVEAARDSPLGREAHTTVAWFRRTVRRSCASGAGPFAARQAPCTGCHRKHRSPFHAAGASTDTITAAGAPVRHAGHCRPLAAPMGWPPGARWPQHGRRTTSRPLWGRRSGSIARRRTWPGVARALWMGRAMLTDEVAARLRQGAEVRPRRREGRVRLLTGSTSTGRRCDCWTCCWPHTTQQPIFMAHPYFY